MKTILVPVDFSVVTGRVIAAALRLAKQLAARVVLVHVVPKPAAIRNVLPAIEDVTAHARASEHESAAQLLALQRALRRKAPDLRMLTLAGPAAKRIVEQARDQKAAYIVLGSHGHSAVRAALVGSVAAAVMKTAPCPVVVVPPVTASA